jgi:hypothetical protein
MSNSSYFGSEICIGDILILQHLKLPEGWIHAQGYLDDDCYLSKESNNFENKLWQIFVQGQYSALEDYKLAVSEDSHRTHPQQKSQKRMKKAFPSDKGDSDSDSDNDNHNVNGTEKSDNESLPRLYQAAVNERKLNEKLMNMKIGKVVAFGDVFQLKHVKSGRFLTASHHHVFE